MGFDALDAGRAAADPDRGASCPAVAGGGLAQAFKTGIASPV
jgi:hypothetical protein